MEKTTLNRLADALANAGFEIVSLKEHRDRVSSNPEKIGPTGFVELAISRLGNGATFTAFHSTPNGEE
jgi:hypothetical protein